MCVSIVNYTKTYWVLIDYFPRNRNPILAEVLSPGMTGLEGFNCIYYPGKRGYIPVNLSFFRSIGQTNEISLYSKLLLHNSINYTGT